MAMHNALRNVQSLPRALTHRLGGEEQRKDLWPMLFRDPRTVVLYLHHHPGIFNPGIQVNFPCTSQGVGSVVDQIRPDLVEIATVGAQIAHQVAQDHRPQGDMRHPRSRSLPVGCS